MILNLLKVLIYETVAYLLSKFAFQSSGFREILVSILDPKDLFRCSQALEISAGIVFQNRMSEQA
jgi:hypothetical protein